MASWHQQRTGAVQPNPVQWAIVTDPPDDVRSVRLEPTECAARARLYEWQQNGWSIAHSYILAPRPPIIDRAMYVKLRHRLDRADRWIDGRRGRGYRPEESPRYVQNVTNDLRSQVEIYELRSQVEIYELYRDRPERLTAYATAGGKITTWPGVVIGSYRELSNWRDKHGNAIRQLECRLPYLGTYRGRNSGDGVYVNLRRISAN